MFLFFYTKNIFHQQQQQVELESLQSFIRKKIRESTIDITSTDNNFLSINEPNSSKVRWRIALEPPDASGDIEIKMYLHDIYINSSYATVDISR